MDFWASIAWFWYPFWRGGSDLQIEGSGDGRWLRFAPGARIVARCGFLWRGKDGLQVGLEPGVNGMSEAGIIVACSCLSSNFDVVAAARLCRVHFCPVSTGMETLWFMDGLVACMGISV